MADGKKLIDHLTCSVCFGLFVNPKYLSCYHSFCEKCLEKMQPQSIIICPICRKETTVPKTGVKELDNNFFISSLVDDLMLQRRVSGNMDAKCGICCKGNPANTFCAECTLFLCHDCDKQHQSISTSQNHRIMSISELRNKEDEQSVPKSKMRCHYHDTELKFYCETCDQLICMHCTASDHDGHRWYTLNTAVEMHRDELQKATAPLNELSSNLSEASRIINSAREKIQQEGDEASKTIDDHYDGLILRLEEQRKQLKQQVDDLVSEKVKRITLELEKMEHAQAEVLSVKELSNTLNSSSDQNLLTAKQQVISLMQCTTSKYKSLTTDIIQQASMKFVSSVNLLPQCGWLCSTATPDPHNCEVVDFPEDIFKSNTTKFTIAVKDDSGYHCYRENTQVNVQLDAEWLQVTDTKDGRYEVSFVALEIGKANLSIFVNGTQIKGSPFKIMVNRPYKTVNQLFKTIDNYGSLGRPWGIVFGRDGMWAVTDYSTSFVYIYDSRDELVKMIGSPGKKDDQFECPFGVAFDDNNNLYVVDGGNSRIQKFDLQGNFLFQFGQEKLRNARGITVHNDKVHVADKANRCVSVFDTNGKHCYTIKSQQLRTPCNVIVSINNQLHITDCDNHCIHTFTLDGKHLSKFGITGNGRGQLSKPWGIAADLRGNLLVTDAKNHHVSIFDKNGVYVHCFGTKGQGDGEFNTPFGIALSPKGRIYVCDYENKRIQVF